MPRKSPAPARPTQDRQPRPLSVLHPWANPDGQSLAMEAEAYRHAVYTIRPQRR